MYLFQVLSTSHQRRRNAKVIQIPSYIRETALSLQQLQQEPLAAYIYDLPALQQHLVSIKSDLPEQVELFYAVKANPNQTILSHVSAFVDGLEIASGGELELITSNQINKPYIFGGPGKLDQDISKALEGGVEMLHLESAGELERVIGLAEQYGQVAPILLRLNPELPKEMQTTLTMAGRATAFGIDESNIDAVIERAINSPWIDLYGFHIHALSHQLDAERHLTLIQYLLQRSIELAGQHQVDLRMINLGGGIGINYRVPEQQYDWAIFAAGLKQLVKQPLVSDLKLRFEMGRFLTAFCGYYVMEVMDLKCNHGQNFAICRGGTHQFRLPVAQGHSHPFICVPGSPDNRPRQELYDSRVTIAGQLCTPKDILASDAEVKRIATGDLVVFPLAGAYAWNISHQQFLCHPAPVVRYLET